MKTEIDESLLCEECYGEKIVSYMCNQCSGSGEGMHESQSCRKCKGTGGLELHCQTCKGTGQKPEEEE